MVNVRPIVVTGSHRSGSTWVGKMLASSSMTTYIHEPFNGMCRPGICPIQFPHVYTYINKENEAEFYPALSNMLSFRYSIQAELSTVRTPRDLVRLTRDFLKFKQSNALNSVPLVKDPMALLASEWLFQRFHAYILILIRHPAAFVSSCHQLSWPFHLQNLLSQHLLMNDYLEPLRAEIAAVANEDPRSIKTLATLWKSLYYVVLKFRDQYPDWLFLRYEDICRSPAQHYQKIFSSVGLEFTLTSQSLIQDSTSYSNYKGTFQEIHSIKRDSKKNVHVWKNRLTAAEIQQVRAITEEVACEFYGDEDW